MKVYDIGNRGKHKLPFIYTRDKNGNCTAKAEDLWNGVFDWARLHNLEYNEQQVVKIAPT